MHLIRTDSDVFISVAKACPIVCMHHSFSHSSSKGDAHTEQTCGHKVCEELRVAWKRVTAPCKIAGGKALYYAGSSNQVLCGNLERRGGVAGSGGDICVPVADSC